MLVPLLRLRRLPALQALAYRIRVVRATWDYARGSLEPHRLLQAVGPVGIASREACVVCELGLRHPPNGARVGRTPGRHGHSQLWRASCWSDQPASTARLTTACGSRWRTMGSSGVVGGGVDSSGAIGSGIDGSGAIGSVIDASDIDASGVDGSVGGVHQALGQIRSASGAIDNFARWRSTQATQHIRREHG